jgi:hypothetical protein
MNKKIEAEYPDIINWENLGDKIWEKILWRDEETGTYIRLVRADPGFEGSDTLIHDFDELVYVLQGNQSNVKTGQVWRQGMFSYFPEGTEHGPFSTNEGIVGIEFRFYRESSNK